MGLRKLERVLWRIRTTCPNQKILLNSVLRRCIMVEIGTSEPCYFNNRKALVRLGWIKKFKTKKFILTDADITSNY